jgi:hypothetical protein
MNELFPNEKVFACQINTTIGKIWPVHIGDHIKVIPRGDGLWNLFIEGVHTGFSIDANRINELAGWKLVEV